MDNRVGFGASHLVEVTDPALQGMAVEEERDRKS